MIFGFSWSVVVVEVKTSRPRIPNSGHQKAKDPLGNPIAGLEGVAFVNSAAQLKKTSAPRPGMRMERMPQGIIMKLMAEVRESFGSTRSGSVRL
jgi:hypothetical protein